MLNPTVSDARWLFTWMHGGGNWEETRDASMPVYVYSSGEYGATASGIQPSTSGRGGQLRSSQPH